MNNSLGILARESTKPAVTEEQPSIEALTAEVAETMSSLEQSFATIATAGNSVGILAASQKADQDDAFVKESITRSLESLGVYDTENADVALVIKSGEEALEGITAKIYDLIAKGMAGIANLFKSRAGKLRSSYEKAQKSRDAVKDSQVLQDAEAGKFEDDGKSEKIGIVKMDKLSAVLPTTFLTSKNMLDKSTLKKVSESYTGVFASLNTAISGLYDESITKTLEDAFSSPSKDSLKAATKVVKEIEKTFEALVTEVKKNPLVDEVSKGNVGLVVADKVEISNNTAFSSEMSDLLEVVTKEGFLTYSGKDDIKFSVITASSMAIGKVEGDDEEALTKEAKELQAELTAFATKTTSTIAQLESVAEKANKYLLDMLTSVADQRASFYEKVAKLPAPKKEEKED